MKVPLFADLHLREDKEHGVPVFSRIIGLCVDNGYKSLVCAGDLWHFRRSIPVTPMAHLRRELENAAGAGIDMYFAPGNHDFVNDTEGAEHAMDILSGYHRVHVAERPYTEYTLEDGTRLVLMPFCPDPKTVRKLLKEIPNPEQVVLIGHQSVKGAKDLYHLSESEIQPAWYKPFKAVFMGDYHTRQKVGPVQYIGATIQHDFGDVGEERGLCVYDTQTGAVEWVEVASPKYYQIDTPASLLSSDAVQKQISDIPQGSYLKLVLHGTDSEISACDTAGMRKSLLEGQGVRMFSEPHPTVTNPVRLDVPVSSPLEVILDEYVDKANLGTLDPAKLKMLSKEIMSRVPDEEAISEHIGVRIDSLTLRNVGSFEFVKFLLRDGITMIMGVNLDEGGSNAAGKSNLLNGLLLANYWDTEQGIDLDSQIRWGQKDMGIVEELSDSAGNKYEIERTRSLTGGSTASLKINGAEKENSVPEVNKAVAKLLRMDKTLFCHVIYMTQEGDRSFADATDSERRKVLSRILPSTDRLDKALKLAKTNRDKGTETITQHENELNSARSKHTEVSAKDYRALYEQFEAERLRNVEAHSHNLQVLEEQKSQKNASLMALTVPVVATRPEAAELRTLLAQKPTVQAKKEEWVRFQSSKQTEQRNVQSRYEDMVAAANRALEAPEGSTCNTCGQSITKESAESYKDRLLQQAEHYRSTSMPPIVDGLSQASKALDQFKTIEDQFTAAETKLAVFASEEVTAQQEVNRVSSLRTQMESEIRNIDFQITTQTSLRDAEKTKENPYEKMSAERDQRLRELEEEMRVATERLAQAREATRHFDFWVDAFGPKGVRSFMFDEFVNSLTGRINDFIGSLFDGVYITISTTKESGAGDLKEALVINIWKDGNSISINRFSGGEQRLIRLAINLSVAFAAQERLQVSIGLLILDEVFENLDSYRIQRVARMLRGLRTVVPTIMLVSHVASLQDQIDTTLVVQKLNGISTIVKEAA